MPDNATNLVQFTDDILDWGGSRLRSFDERARAAIRQRPMMYLVGALVTGCLVGRVLSRW
jgi:hypothetical protein